MAVAWPIMAVTMVVTMAVAVTMAVDVTRGRERQVQGSCPNSFVRFDALHSAVGGTLQLVPSF